MEKTGFEDQTYWVTGKELRLLGGCAFLTSVAIFVALILIWIVRVTEFLFGDSEGWGSSTKLVAASQVGFTLLIAWGIWHEFKPRLLRWLEGRKVPAGAIEDHKEIAQVTEEDAAPTGPQGNAEL